MAAHVFNPNTPEMLVELCKFECYYTEKSWLEKSSEHQPTNQLNKNYERKQYLLGLER